jgi:hypothetical protein
MKPKNIFWGALLIALGTIFLLDNVNLLDFSWDFLWKFWPLVLIVFGLILFIKNDLIKIILAALAAIILALTFYASFKSVTGSFNDGIEFYVDEDDVISGEIDTSNYAVQFAPDLNSATFKLDAGAGTFLLKGVTDSLLSAKSFGIKNNYILNSQIQDSYAFVKLKMKKTRFSIDEGKVKNKLDVNLNKKPKWNLDLDLGAATVDFDLSKHKIEKLNLDVGAASVKLKLSDLLDESNISIDAGASKIEIEVPESVGCELKVDASLSSKNVSGFNQLNSEHYQTENFESSKKKIYIKIDCGVSSIEVKRNN